MGTVRLDPIPPKRTRRRLPALHLPTPWLAAALVVVLVLAPDPWLRALVATVALLIVYGEGWLDGRRDMALDLVRPRRDDRVPRAAPRPIAEQPGEGEGAA